MKLGHFLNTIHKNKLKVIKVLNIRPETMKFGFSKASDSEPSTLPKRYFLIRNMIKVLKTTLYF